MVAGRLRAASESTGTPEGKVRALLEIPEIFPAEIASNQAVQSMLAKAYRHIDENGAADAVAAYATGRTYTQ